MGVFNSLFGSKEPQKEKVSYLKWIPLSSLDQLDTIKKQSKTESILIFKHSTRCSISRFVLTDFTAHFTYSANEFGAHYLDLLNQRAISNAIAERFEVQHHSPQLIIIKNGKAVASASHEGINDLQLSDFL